MLFFVCVCYNMFVSIDDSIIVMNFMMMNVGMSLMNKL